jgi:hypothetical protein
MAKYTKRFIKGKNRCNSGTRRNKISGRCKNVMCKSTKGSMYFDGI